MNENIHSVGPTVPNRQDNEVKPILSVYFDDQIEAIRRECRQDNGQVWITINFRYPIERKAIMYVISTV